MTPKEMAREMYIGRRARLAAGTELSEIRGNTRTRRVRCRKTRNVTIEGITFVGETFMALFWHEGRRRFYADSRLLELLPEGYLAAPDRLRISLLATRTTCSH